MALPQAIYTQRLCLRQWHRQDRQPFAALNADPKVMRYFPKCLNRQESDALAERCEILIRENGWGFWALEEQKTNNFIGFVGLHKPAAKLPFQPCIEIGWRLARPAWKQGFASEAARAALDFGFKILKLNEIVAFTAIRNEPSIAVMKRLKMERDNDLFKHPDLPAGSPLSKHCLYRLSKQSWSEQELQT